MYLFRKCFLALSITFIEKWAAAIIFTASDKKDEHHEIPFKFIDLRPDFLHEVILKCDTETLLNLAEALYGERKLLETFSRLEILMCFKEYLEKTIKNSESVALSCFNSVSLF